MDNRRLDSWAVLGSGILDKPAPTTDIPSNRERFDTRGHSEAEALAALEAGLLLDVPEYYGCVSAWKDDQGYHGRLLQYRSVTESPEFTTAEACRDWFTETVVAVEG